VVALVVAVAELGKQPSITKKRGRVSDPSPLLNLRDYLVIVIIVMCRTWLCNCFVDTKIAAISFLAVKLGDGCFSGGVIFHFHETKPLGAASLAVDNDVSTYYSAVLGEQVPKLIFGGVVTHVTNINFLCH